MHDFHLHFFLLSSSFLLLLLCFPPCRQPTHLPQKRSQKKTKHYPIVPNYPLVRQVRPGDQVKVTPNDTVSLANSASLANRLLHGVQRHGHSLGLSLNTAKCEHLALNSQERLYFRSGNPLNRCTCQHCGGEGLGDPMPLVDSATYPGCRSTRLAPPHILSRPAFARQTQRPYC